MAGKTTSKSKQAYLTSYKANSRWKTNREKKLKRAQKRTPNDETIAIALKDIHYRRRSPNATRAWPKTNIRIARLFKEFTGRADPALFSSNPKTQAAAIAARGPKQLVNDTTRVSFSLAARAHSAGQLVWS